MLSDSTQGLYCHSGVNSKYRPGFSKIPLQPEILTRIEVLLPNIQNLVKYDVRVSVILRRTVCGDTDISTT